MPRLRQLVLAASDREQALRDLLAAQAPHVTAARLALPGADGRTVEVGGVRFEVVPVEEKT